jgi:DNA-binding NarL/FixJ family response regulator
MIKLQPQIVCVDLGSSDDEGFEKLAVLREGLPKSLLFLVSGKFDANTVQTASERGVHGFIVKPFNAGTVLATIRKAIIKIAKQHRQRTADDTAA